VSKSLVEQGIFEWATRD